MWRGSQTVGPRSEQCACSLSLSLSLSLSRCVCMCCDAVISCHRAVAVRVEVYAARNGVESTMVEHGRLHASLEVPCKGSNLFWRPRCHLSSIKAGQVDNGRAGRYFLLQGSGAARLQRLPHIVIWATAPPIDVAATVGPWLWRALILCSSLAPTVLALCCCPSGFVE
jgi:hypothetical protein